VSVKTKKYPNKKIIICNNFIDQEGNKTKRGSRDDFRSIRARHLLPMQKICNDKNDNALNEWIRNAMVFYDFCNYGLALNNLQKALSAAKKLYPLIFYYIRICEHIVSTPLTIEDISYEKYSEKYNKYPKWIRWIYPKPKNLMRCKWCGRYTDYIYPNVPTYGFMKGENSCTFCGRMYPMPSWLWDSPDGRAYSYFRGSFNGEEFYWEFEKDYDPKPKR